MGVRRYVIGAAIAGLAIAGMGSGPALAKPSRPTPSGNMNLSFQGVEYATVASEPTTIQVDGLGQLIADKQGNLSGAETFTAVNGEGQTENVCTGSVAGSITPPNGNFGSGDGSFTASLVYTPANGAGAYCFPSGTTTTMLLCNRTLLHENLASELDAGTYHCVATGVSVSGGSDTINAATMRARIGITRGNNAPNS
jgi:hypothetical protein